MIPLSSTLPGFRTPAETACSSIRIPSLYQAYFLAALFVLFACFAPPVMAEEVAINLDESWTFTNGAEYPGAEGSSSYDAAAKALVISYSFEKGGAYVASWHKLEDINDVIGLQVEAQGPGGFLGVSIVDSTGQNFIYRLKMLTDQKEVLSVLLSKPSTSYGGANDKVVSFPLKSIRIMVEKNPTVISGKIMITKLAFQK